MRDTRKPATMTDVARLASVSQATVSYVLNNDTKYAISDKTRAAVLSAARELDYQPNTNARNLVSGKSSTVVCLVPPVQLVEPVLALLGELTLEFARRGMVLAVHIEEVSDESLDTLRRALRPAAIFPLLNPLGALSADITLSEPGSRLQVQHLISRGHRRLAFAGPDVASLADVAAWRLQSVRGAADEHGLDEVHSATFALDGSDAAMHITEWHTAGVTGVCAYNDDVALAILKGIRDVGLRCPEDIAVIGYDATTAGRTVEPPLTSISWQARDIADLLVDQILATERVDRQQNRERYAVAVRLGGSA